MNEYNALVSVIIPTYNREVYLKQTIQSILSQTYKNIEIIVVDDGTLNTTNEVLCKKFDKVKYIKIENSGGPAKPRNEGIRKSKGKYIAFVDDDDLWLSTKLEQQIAILEDNPDFGLVHTCCEVIDENGVKINEIIGRPRTLNMKHGDVSMRMMGNWTIMMPTPLVRRTVIEKVGGFNENIAGTYADVEYWSRCSFATKFYFVNEPLVEYRMHNNNMSSNSLNYLQLPLSLKNVIQEQLLIERITKEQYFILLSSLAKMQIKMVKISFFKTFKNLFLLDYFWIFKRNNCKMFAYILFFKK